MANLQYVSTYKVHVVKKEYFKGEQHLKNNIFSSGLPQCEQNELRDIKCLMSSELPWLLTPA